MNKYETLKELINQNKLSSNTLQSLVQEGLDINHIDEKGRTALWHACRSENLDLVQLLIQSGANIDCMRIEEHLSKQHIKKRQEMLTMGVKERIELQQKFRQEKDEDEKKGLSPNFFYLAVQLGNIDLIKLLLDNDFNNADWPDPISNLKPISRAVLNDETKIFFIILNHLKKVRGNKNSLTKNLSKWTDDDYSRTCSIFDGRNSVDWKKTITYLIHSDMILKKDLQAKRFINTLEVEEFGIYIDGGNADDNVEGAIFRVQSPTPLKFEYTSLQNWSYNQYVFQLKWTDQNGHTSAFNIKMPKNELISPATWEENFDNKRLIDLNPIIELAQYMGFSHLTLESFFRLILYVANPLVQLDFCSKESWIWGHISPDKQTHPDPLLKEHFSKTAIKDIPKQTI